MTTSLYDLSVGCSLQTLGAVGGFLELGRKHFAAAGEDLDALTEVRLFEDMAPLRFQIISVAHHSLGAIEGLRSGAFAPPSAIGAMTYAELQALVADAEAGLKALTPGEIDSLAGKDVTFSLGERRLPFTAENFILSFSLPNFYFHATTAYDILRMKGAPLGKRNYMGQLRMKA
jgi:hypothetical protein